MYCNSCLRRISMEVYDSFHGLCEKCFRTKHGGR